MSGPQIRISLRKHSFRSIFALIHSKASKTTKLTKTEAKLAITAGLRPQIGLRTWSSDHSCLAACSKALEGLLRPFAPAFFARRQVGHLDDRATDSRGAKELLLALLDATPCGRLQAAAKAYIFAAAVSGRLDLCFSFERA